MQVHSRNLRRSVGPRNKAGQPTQPVTGRTVLVPLDGHIAAVHFPAMSSSNNDAMAAAIAEAEKARDRGEVPVGAVIVAVASGDVIARAGNRCEADHDPTAHAEMLAIRAAAAALDTQRLSSCDLYVTLEPCPMCATAISFARLRRVYFGAYDPKGGGVEHGARIFQQPTCHHRPEVIGGVEEARSSELLRQFFSERR